MEGRDPSCSSRSENRENKRLRGHRVKGGFKMSDEVYRPKRRWTMHRRNVGKRGEIITHWASYPGNYTFDPSCWSPARNTRFASKEIMKTKAKHTPGPWEIVGASQVVKFGEDWACIAEISNPRSESEKQKNSRAHIHARVEIGDDRFNEACANARLIAAAPDLLEAVKLALEFFYSPTKFNPVEVERTFEAAISLAAQPSGAVAQVKRENGV